MAKVRHLGWASPDDPIYSTGLIVGGRRLGQSKNELAKQANIEHESEQDVHTLPEKANDTET